MISGAKLATLIDGKAERSSQYNQQIAESGEA